MIDKLLSIENEYITIIREILSNLHLEEEAIVSHKSTFRSLLLEERVLLRKRARSLRCEKSLLISANLGSHFYEDFESIDEAIISFFPSTEIELISELKDLESQKRLLLEKTLLQLKLNKNIKAAIKHYIPLAKQSDPIAKKPKTLIL